MEKIWVEPQDYIRYLEHKGYRDVVLCECISKGFGMPVPVCKRCGDSHVMSYETDDYVIRNYKLRIKRR